MKIKFYLSLALLLSTQLAFAQLTITSMTPANGATGVGLTATRSFTFSNSLDTTRLPNRNEPIGIIPTTDESAFSFVYAFSNQNRTITFDMIQEDSTDVGCVVLGARTPSGQWLSRPYALNYSTAANHGTQTISGTISSPAGNVNNAVVVLETHNLLGSEGDRIVSAAVVADGGGNGAYTLPYIRNGVWWPIAAIDLNNDGDIKDNDAIGFYDPNNDGIPDPITVNNNSPANVNITVHALDWTAGRQWIPRMNSIATTVRSDARLVFLVATRYIAGQGDSISLGGLAQSWCGVYYSTLLGRAFAVYTNTQFSSIDTAAQMNIPTTLLTIPTNIVDSDSALAIAERNGGAAFRSAHPGTRVSISGSNMYGVSRNEPQNYYWQVYYMGVDTSRSFYVNMIPTTGVSGDNSSHLPKEFTLSPIYPNPFNPTASVKFNLPEASIVKISVYDVMGRLVTTLVNGKMTAGYHETHWDGSHSESGVYFITIRANNFVATRKALLLK